MFIKFTQGEKNKMENENLNEEQKGFSQILKELAEVQAILAKLMLSW